MSHFFHTLPTALVLGISIGSIYAIAASGLVVTYTTSGIFNFAHGAVGMIAAYGYWQLRVQERWPAPIALAVIIVVAAPVMGAVIERYLIRPLKDMSLATTLVVSIALMVGLMGIADIVWPATSSRDLPQFFNGHFVKIAGVNVSWHTLITVGLAVAVALVLRWLLYSTRIGLAMRAQVDNRELTSLNGARLGRISMLSWALGFSLAALGGILLAPIVQLDVTTLTLLVINAYAAAMIGRLRSLPLTYLGAMILGIGSTLAKQDLPTTSAYTNLTKALPTLFLFATLLFLPRARVRAGQLVRAADTRVPSFRAGMLGGVILVAMSVFAVRAFNATYVTRFDTALAVALILLSLVLLTGYGGQVSLCQMTFAGIGAYAVVHFHIGGYGSPLAYIAAAVLAAFVGALVALPAIRLQGLYLALSTMAFASLADNLFFSSKAAFGGYGTAHVARIHLGGLRVESDRAYGILLGVVFAAVALGVVALRRGPMGRRLAAMRDSPAACATLGMDLTRTKLAVFVLSAGIAGLGGALFAGVGHSASASDYNMIQSLPLLVMGILGGITASTGALIGGASLWLFSPFFTEHIQGVLFVGYLAVAASAVHRAMNTPQPVSVSARWSRMPGLRTLGAWWASLGPPVRRVGLALLGATATTAGFLLVNHESSKLTNLVFVMTGFAGVTLASYPDGIAVYMARMLRPAFTGLGMGRLLDLAGMGRTHHEIPPAASGKAGSATAAGPAPSFPPTPHRRFDDAVLGRHELVMESEEVFVTEVPLTLDSGRVPEGGVLDALDPLAGTLAGSDRHDTDHELEVRLEAISHHARTVGPRNL